MGQQMDSLSSFSSSSCFSVSTSLTFQILIFGTHETSHETRAHTQRRTHGLQYSNPPPPSSHTVHKGCLYIQKLMVWRRGRRKSLSEDPRIHLQGQWVKITTAGNRTQDRQICYPLHRNRKLGCTRKFVQQYKQDS